MDTINKALVLSLASLAIVGSALCLSAPAKALTPTPMCVVTTYFSNAPHNGKIVGSTAACPGSPYQVKGTTSPYFTIVRSIAPGVQNPPPAGKLPCEFLAEGCSEYLPLPHH